MAFGLDFTLPSISASRFPLSRPFVFRLVLGTGGQLQRQHCPSVRSIPSRLFLLSRRLAVCYLCKNAFLHRRHPRRRERRLRAADLHPHLLPRRLLRPAGPEQHRRVRRLGPGRLAHRRRLLVRRRHQHLLQRRPHQHRQRRPGRHRGWLRLRHGRADGHRRPRLLQLRHRAAGQLGLQLRLHHVRRLHLRRQPGQLHLLCRRRRRLGRLLPGHGRGPQRVRLRRRPHQLLRRLHRLLHPRLDHHPRRRRDDHLGRARHRRRRQAQRRRLRHHLQVRVRHRQDGQRQRQQRVRHRQQQRERDGQQHRVRGCGDGVELRGGGEEGRCGVCGCGGRAGGDVVVEAGLT